MLLRMHSLIAHHTPAFTGLLHLDDWSLFLASLKLDIPSIPASDVPEASWTSLSIRQIVYSGDSKEVIEVTSPPFPPVALPCNPFGADPWSTARPVTPTRCRTFLVYFICLLTNRHAVFSNYVFYGTIPTRPARPVAHIITPQPLPRDAIIPRTPQPPEWT